MLAQPLARGAEILLRSRAGGAARCALAGSRAADAAALVDVVLERGAQLGSVVVAEVDLVVHAVERERDGFTLALFDLRAVDVVNERGNYFAGHLISFPSGFSAC